MWKELKESLFARERENFFFETTPPSPIRVLGRFHASLSVLEIVLERTTTPIHNGAEKDTLLF
jgi:hypothetical protein